MYLGDDKSLFTVNFRDTVTTIQYNLYVVMEINKDNCHSSCDGCSAPNEANKCISCANKDMKLLNGECIQECPGGSYDTALGTCIGCP